MTEVNKSPLVTYGIIGGVALIAYTVILYLAGLSVFTSGLSLISYLIPVVVAILAVLKAKKDQGGYLGFKQALKISFGVLLIISLLSTIFNYVLLYVIDVPFGEALMQQAEIKTEKLMVQFGAKQEQIDQTLEKMRDPSSRSLGNMLLGFSFYAIIWFIVAAIISAIIKKKKPEFEENQF